MLVLERYGWRGPPEAGLARVVGSHGGWCRLVCDEADGAILARLKKGAFAHRASREGAAAGLERTVRCVAGRESERPIAGDFVDFEYNPHGESFVTGLRPRFSVLERRESGGRRRSQVLAANFDTLFVMTSLNADFSVPRVRRFLSLAAEGRGEARVVVVLSKTDLRKPDDDERIAALRAAAEAGGADFLAISCVAGEGLDDVRRHCGPGRTIALVGSSGVGKSTLLNALAGREVAAVGEIQEWSGRGRHTTAARTLTLLPDGTAAIDTPGVREVGVADDAPEPAARRAASHRWREK